MALYTEACTIVRTDAGLSESFEVKVGLHQWSVGEGGVSWRVFSYIDYIFYANYLYSPN